MRTDPNFRDDIWVVVLIVLSCIGFFTALALWIYILYKIISMNIKTKNLWLSQATLLFVFLSYGSCFIFIVVPNTTTCAAIRFLPGVCYAGLFAGLLLKSLNILTESRHVYTASYVQAFLFTAIVVVQLVISIEWLILRPPLLLYLDYGNGSERLLCSSSLEDIILSLVYVMALLLLLCVTTWAARRNTIIHREEAFLLSVCVGFLIPIWVAWCLLGSIGHRRYNYEDPCLAFGLLATASLVLLLVFLPRARRLSKFSRELQHITYGDAQYAVPHKLMTANTTQNPTPNPGGPLLRTNLHQSNLSLPSQSQFSPLQNVIVTNPNVRIGSRSGNARRPDSHIYITPSSLQKPAPGTTLFLSRDHMYTDSDGTHL